MRTLVEGLQSRKEAMIAALWANCVTTDIEILTRRGWLLHDEVVVGDETIGMNIETGQNEWTPVTRIHVFKSAPVVELSNSRWSVVTTEDHRWLVRQRNGHIHFRALKDMNASTYMVHSVPFIGSEGLPISDDEAAVVGWILGDGYQDSWQRKDGGYGRAFSICQAKESQVELIDELVSGLPHSRFVRKAGREKPLIAWRFEHRYSEDLWSRSGLDEVAPVEFVLRLSRTQLESFMEAMWLAEGHMQKNRRGISQNKGSIADAIELGVYLLGYKPSKTNSARQPNLLNITYGRPTVRFYHLDKTSVGSRDVWCVSTALGSWTARNSTSVFLTGNSNYDRQSQEDEQAPRTAMIEEIEESYAKTIAHYVSGKPIAMADQADNSQRPEDDRFGFFAAGRRGEKKLYSKLEDGADKMTVKEVIDYEGKIDQG